MNRGIDYGNGTTNIDKQTGIRYGVISQHEVLQAWCDKSEADYGKPTCPECGDEVTDASTIDTKRFKQLYSHGCEDYACAYCRLTLDSSDVYGDEALAHNYDSDGYQASQSGDDSAIFILKSPFYTRAQFCSPCAPGACYLMSPIDDGDKAYCFGHDWFDDGRAPYPVYRVADDTLVEPE